MIAILAYALLFGVIIAVTALSYEGFPRRDVRRPVAPPPFPRVSCRHPGCAKFYASASSRNRHERTAHAQWAVYDPTKLKGGGR